MKMNKDEYMHKIKQETGFLLPSSQSRVLSHFRSLLNSSLPDENILETLGEPYAALQEYFKNEKKSTSHSIPKTILYIAIALFSPLIVTVLCSGAAMVILAAAVIFVFLAAFTFISIAMWLGGIGIAVNSIFQSYLISDKLIQMGFGFIISGLGIVFMMLVYKLYKLVIPLLLRGASKLYAHIESRLKNEE